MSKTVKTTTCWGCCQQLGKGISRGSGPLVTSQILMLWYIPESGASIRSKVWTFTAGQRSHFWMQMQCNVNIRYVRCSRCQSNWPLIYHVLTLLTKRSFAKRASWASGDTGRWSFQDGWSSAWRTSVPGAGTATGPVASARMRSPGASAGAAPATTPGTKARAWRSPTSPSAPPSASTWTSRRASSTSTSWRRVRGQPRRSSCCSRSRAPSRGSWSQASGWAHSPAAWSERRMNREIKRHCYVFIVFDNEAAGGQHVDTGLRFLFFLPFWTFPESTAPLQVYSLVYLLLYLFFILILLFSYGPIYEYECMWFVSNSKM